MGLIGKNSVYMAALTAGFMIIDGGPIGQEHDDIMPSTDMGTLMRFADLIIKDYIESKKKER